LDKIEMLFNKSIKKDEQPILLKMKIVLGAVLYAIIAAIYLWDQLILEIEPNLLLLHYLYSLEIPHMIQMTFWPFH
jgi:hypothetical protein